MTRWARRRRELFAPLACAFAAAATSFVACQDPKGNDPNVPDDEVAAAAGAVGGPAAPADGGVDAALTCPSALPTCPSPPPSYKNDIAPLIQRDCEPCHEAGGVAQDRNLTKYANVYKIRTTVLTQTYGCLMPPLDAGVPDAGPVGPLDAGDRLLLLQWLECHSPNN